ncbi:MULTISPECIES: uracil-DNA glycosylase [unclassified Arthrobacter]|uniref:uracil-DNA glycosylase n=1 Tax=unclassified Arthrobacter TaxID=235627 RepID=UPI001C85CE65|nr:uracil-DNA glycosylase [Arthrobacter sp. MAHUQ-56]MBX7442244.1 uracil-DNA glycosylase [Arthrobacter sp. MAHUQ-56]
MRDPAVSAFVDRLAAVETGPDSTNFFDHAVPANGLRRRNLELYLQEMLDRRPKVLLVGEAPGFRGMRITGVPFTNRTILGGPANSFGLFGPGKGYVLPPEAAGVPAEPTATVLWQVLAELDFLPLLWSAFPWHSHRPGLPQTNRTPRPSETKLGTPFWQELSELFGIETLVAVGNVAQHSLKRVGLDVPKIRHPAHGGREGFKQGLQELLDSGMQA